LNKSITIKRLVEIIFINELKGGICVGWAKVIDFHLKGSIVGLKCIKNITMKLSSVWLNCG